MTRQNHIFFQKHLKAKRLHFAHMPVVPHGTCVSNCRIHELQHNGNRNRHRMTLALRLGAKPDRRVHTAPRKKGSVNNTGAISLRAVHRSRPGNMCRAGCRKGGHADGVLESRGCGATGLQEITELSRHTKKRGSRRHPKRECTLVCEGVVAEGGVRLAGLAGSSDHATSVWGVVLGTYCRISPNYP